MECLHGEEKGEWIAARVLTLLMAEGESVH